MNFTDRPSDSFSGGSPEPPHFPAITALLGAREIEEVEAMYEGRDRGDVDLALSALRRSEQRRHRLQRQYNSLRKAFIFAVGMLAAAMAALFIRP
jgi:hypothetical protein